MAQLAFLRTNWNVPDALNKVSHNTYLDIILTTGTMDHPEAQRVVRRRMLAQKRGGERRNAPLQTGLKSTADGSTSFV
jgi:hypothetical protein